MWTNLFVNSILYAYILVLDTSLKIRLMIFHYCEEWLYFLHSVHQLINIGKWIQNNNLPFSQFIIILSALDRDSAVLYFLKRDEGSGFIILLHKSRSYLKLCWENCCFYFHLFFPTSFHLQSPESGARGARDPPKLLLMGDVDSGNGQYDL